MVLQAGSLCGSVVSCQGREEGDNEIPGNTRCFFNGDSCYDWTVFWGQEIFLRLEYFNRKMMGVCP